MSNDITIPRTLIELQERFATEEACEHFLFRWRWPDGFSCPRCGHSEATKLRLRRQHQCKGCGHQVSVTAGTALHKTHLSLRIWLIAIFLVARHKKSISALQLQSDLGIGSYRSAWLLLHKIRRCFGEKAHFPLKGIVEVDETLIGAKGKGSGPGRSHDDKAVVVAAIELGRRRSRGDRWKDVRARCVKDFTSRSLAQFVKDVVSRGTTIETDGCPSYASLAKSGFALDRTVMSRIPRRDLGRENPLPHVHLFFSNLKTWLRGRFHGVSRKYLPRYLAEFVYRLNRRHSPHEIFAWVTRRLMWGAPCPLSKVMVPELSA